MMSKKEIFDDWPEKYDQWFKTPIGRLIRKYEGDLVMGMLRPGPGERILDAGCGTGVFTGDFLDTGAAVVGLDLSRPMLDRAVKKLADRPFSAVSGDMRHLPFAENVFDKTVSVTAIEFIKDAQSLIDEFFRVTKPDGLILVATLNSLSPWAVRRRDAAEKGHGIFKHAVFRSPQDMAAFSPVKGDIRTAVHFKKDDEPEQAKTMEERGRALDLDTGAFISVCWKKPA